MSRSVDLFVSSTEPVEALAALIAERCRLELRPRPEADRFDLVDGGLTAVLHRHAFVDDDGLPLSRYPYALSMQTQASGHLGSSREVGFLRRVASSLDGVPVLLVLDLQYRDREPERAGGADE